MKIERREVHGHEINKTQRPNYNGADLPTLEGTTPRSSQRITKHLQFSRCLLSWISFTTRNIKKWMNFTQHYKRVN